MFKLSHTKENVRYDLKALEMSMKIYCNSIYTITIFTTFGLNNAGFYGIYIFNHCL